MDFKIEKENKTIKLIDLINLDINLNEFNIDENLKIDFIENNNIENKLFFYYILYIIKQNNFFINKRIDKIINTQNEINKTIKEKLDLNQLSNLDEKLNEIDKIINILKETLNNNINYKDDLETTLNNLKTHKNFYNKIEIDTKLIEFLNSPEKAVMKDLPNLTETIKDNLKENFITKKELEIILNNLITKLKQN